MRARNRLGKDSSSGLFVFTILLLMAGAFIYIKDSRSLTAEEARALQNSNLSKAANEEIELVIKETKNKIKREVDLGKGYTAVYVVYKSTLDPVKNYFINLGYEVRVNESTEPAFLHTLIVVWSNN